jgi:hypothetical protein
MKRSTFILISAILATLFGLSMLLAPEQMIKNMTTAADPSALHVLQWAGNMLLAIAVVNFLSRNDEGSVALRAVMIGNIFMHTLALGVDYYDYSIGFINMQGLGSGFVVHVFLIAGFGYYLLKMGKS